MGQAPRATEHTQNGFLSHPKDLDGPMRVAAQRKTNAYRQTDKTDVNVLQAHRKTEAHFTAAGMPSQRNQSESFRFKTRLSTKT
jgi:hypothetical protein